MLNFNFSIKDYEINSRTKWKLETNLNQLFDLGVEGPAIAIEDHLELCQSILKKIEKDELHFSSQEKRILTLIPAVLLEGSNNDLSLEAFSKTLQIVKEYSKPRRLIVNFLKTSLNHFWSKQIYSHQLIKISIESQRENELDIFNLEVLEDLLGTNAPNQHSRLISKANDFDQLNSLIGLPLRWNKTEYHSLVLGKCILRNSDFNNQYEYYREMVHSISRNYQQSFIGSIYLISSLIVAGKNNSSIQSSLKRLALDHIGDPSNAPRWTRLSAYNNDQQKVIVEAREILNFWITRDFLTIFFEKCLNDVRRKRFWLNYAERIKNFKVYTTPELKSELLKDPRIKGLSSRIRVFGNGRISAIVMNTGTHDLVEFSDDGWAFRAYLRDNDRWRKVLDQRFIESAELLRSVRLPMAVRRRAGSYYDWKRSGTLHHRDATFPWESTFKSWLERTAL